VEAIATEPRLMPHLHLSLQAGDDMILKRMKRRHARADAVAFCAAVRAVRPDVVFGADIIAGFPTETEAMFENSLRLVEDCGLTWLHVFPFSARAGHAGREDARDPGGAIRERAQRLRAAGKAQVARHLAAMQGAKVRLLMERPGFGRTEGFAGTRLPGDHAAGAIVPARVVAQDGEMLVAEAA
jgi:threonylcarbamoyladenosine tRNA methylthiotransferase MtaB